MQQSANHFFFKFFRNLEPTLKKLKVDENPGLDDDENEETDYDAGILKIEKVGSLLRYHSYIT